MRPPNIIVFLIDDLGWKDAACLGSPYYQTPAVDRLAEEGMLFTDAYANAPNCAPTRACLLSGLYSPRHGIYTVNSSARGKTENRKLIPIKNKTELSPQVVTIAEDLKSAGYICAHMGKWHLGDAPHTGPLEQGFDINIGGGRAGHPKSYFSPYQNQYLSDGPVGEYLADRLTEEAVRFIKANREKPFFLYMSHYSVHTPLQAKEELVDKFTERKGAGGHDNPVYAAMIASVDNSLDRLRLTLTELGLENETILIFCSDNGGYGPATSMQPLRGSKGMLYEGGIRVPMIVLFPGLTSPGSICRTPVISLDIFPTLRETAGIKKTGKEVLDGISMLPLLGGRSFLDRDLFWHFPSYLEGYREQGTWRTTPAGAIRSGEWKLIEFFEDGRLELYNLDRDISEKHNLVDTYPEKTLDLHNRLKRWRRITGAPVPSEPNPEYRPNR